MKKEIIKILQENEDCLSDGYHHYCGDEVDKVLNNIADKIIAVFLNAKKAENTKEQKEKLWTK